MPFLLCSRMFDVIADTDDAMILKPVNETEVEMTYVVLYHGKLAVRYEMSRLFRCG